jgi:hypothetical protein
MMTARPGAQEAPRPLPFRCVIGDTLCYLYLLSPAQRDAIPESQRPHLTELYLPGLGWVVASPARLAGRAPGDSRDG